MRLFIVGPGRAGMSVARAAHAAGAVIVGLLGRGDLAPLAEQVGTRAFGWDEELPAVDLVLLAVRDDAIGEVAGRLGPQPGVPVVHMSGVAGLDVLTGDLRGSFHPLQTLPDPITGAERLAGAAVAIAASNTEVEARLIELAGLLRMRPFTVAEDKRALYHAAAAAASNFVVASLAVAHRLFVEAGVDPEYAQPLTEAVVSNVYRIGPDRALTGPVARGDVETVKAHFAAISASAPDVLEGYRALVVETARLAGTSALFEETLS